MPIDYLAASLAHLKADSGVANLVAANVFGAELPREFDDSMPTKCIVLRAAGSPARFHQTTIGDYRIDVRSYGGTPYEAMLVDRAAHWAMKYGMKRIAYGTCLLHSARIESSGNNLREPGVDWPFVLSTWMVTASELAIT